MESFRAIIEEMADQETHHRCLAGLCQRLAEAARRTADEALERRDFILALSYAVEAVTWLEAARLANAYADRDAPDK